MQDKWFNKLSFSWIFAVKYFFENSMSDRTTFHHTKHHYSTLKSLTFIIYKYKTDKMAVWSETSAWMEVPNAVIENNDHSFKMQWKDQNSNDFIKTLQSRCQFAIILIVLSKDLFENTKSLKKCWKYHASVRLLFWTSVRPNKLVQFEQPRLNRVSNILDCIFNVLELIYLELLRRRMPDFRKQVLF